MTPSGFRLAFAAVWNNAARPNSVTPGRLPGAPGALIGHVGDIGHNHLFKGQIST
jgi:hypothetical protein